MAVLSKPLITVDGNVSEWAASQRIDYGDLAGYSLYAQAQGDLVRFRTECPDRRSGPTPRSGSTPT